MNPGPLFALAARLDAANLAPQAALLRSALATQTLTGVRVLLLGLFSVGKSTLINAFLGYPVLPGGLSPTTRTLCQLSYGAAAAVVHFADGRTEALSGPEDLDAYLDMEQALPSPTPTPRAVDRVDLELPLPLLQTGLRIVDSPGLDEVGERTERASRALRESDVVLFLVAADQLLGEVERHFLQNDVLPRGPVTAIVVNFWDRIPLPDRGAVLARLEAIQSDIAATGHSIDRTFCVSALQTLKARWRGRSDIPDTEGVVDLEQWLTQLAADQAALKLRTFVGRIRFTLTTIAQTLRHTADEERIALRDRQSRETETRRRDARIREAAARAKELLAPLRASLLDSAAIRMQSGEGELRAAMMDRLERDPYDPLHSTRAEIAAWWKSTLHSLSQETETARGQVTAVLEPAGIPINQLPSVLVLDIAAPAPDFSGRAPAGAQVKDTITGLLGGFSQSAGDSAAALMKRASRYVSSVNPHAREIPTQCADALENAIGARSYEIRLALTHWVDSLEAALLTVIEPAQSQATSNFVSAQTLRSQSAQRLQELSALEADLNFLLNNLS